MSDLQIAPPPDDALALALKRDALKARLLGEPVPVLRIGRFAIDRVIGRGAMGVVYRAHDERLDRPVAIKVLRADAAGALARLEREARALARLNHPNVVTVYEVGEADAVYIAMEYVQGTNLRDWMTTPRPLRLRIEMLRQAALGLAAAHAIGLLHRDLKPANAIVGDDGRLRICDFGLATAPLPETTLSDDRGAAMSRLTQTGAQLGTPAYMSPESLRGEPPTAASDVFALCCVGWELLFGQHPFEGRERDDPPPLPRDPAVPRALADALRRGLSSRPVDRGDGLRALVAACEPAAPRRRWTRSATLFATIAAAGVVGLVVVGRDPSPVVASADPQCNPTLSSSSRHTLRSDLDLAQQERAPLRAAAAELALGRWQEGCDRLAAIETAEATCWRDHYCRNVSSLPPRARCFGGDVAQCTKAAIPHEYELLASQQAVDAGDASAAASRDLHLAQWTELTEVACELGDRASCDALARRRESTRE